MNKAKADPHAITVFPERSTTARGPYPELLTLEEAMKQQSSDRATQMGEDVATLRVQVEELKRSDGYAERKADEALRTLNGSGTDDPGLRGVIHLLKLEIANLKTGLEALSKSLDEIGKRRGWDRIALWVCAGSLASMAIRMFSEPR